MIDGFGIYMEKLSYLEYLLEEQGRSPSLFGNVAQLPFLTLDVGHGLEGELQYISTDETGKFTEFVLMLKTNVPTLGLSPLELQGLCGLFNETALGCWAHTGTAGDTLLLRAVTAEGNTGTQDFAFHLWLEIYCGDLTQLVAWIAHLQGGSGHEN